MSASSPPELGSRGRALKPCSECGKPKGVGQGRGLCSDECRKSASTKSLRRYRAERKAKLDADKLARGCDRCGYNKFVCALDYHHRDPSTKEFLITRQTASPERTAAEIAKCDLLCANCHREEHHAPATNQ